MLKKLLCRLVILILCCLPALNGCASRESASSGRENNASEEAQGNLQGNDPNARNEGTEENQDAGSADSEGIHDAGPESLGDFSMQDINGENYTQEMFADHELTMVNVFTTWCTPCVREIPELERLHEEMADQGVQVAGVVLDAVGLSGRLDEEAVEKAKLLAEKAEVTYPFLIPDEGYLNGRLAGISAVPETFFVDRDGNIVGETYSGSRSFEEWKRIAEKELSEAAQ